LRRGTDIQWLRSLGNRLAPGPVLVRKLTQAPERELVQERQLAQVLELELGLARKLVQVPEPEQILRQSGSRGCRT
jgi:hypothetical protein